jgi:hypothetical protein
MIRIPQDKSKQYVELDTNDPFICQRATHYTLTPDPSDPKWELITYYSDFNNSYSYIAKTIDNARVRIDYKSPFKY